MWHYFFFASFTVFRSDCRLSANDYQLQKKDVLPDDNDDMAGDAGVFTVQQNLSGLSKEERLKLLMKDSPELPVLIGEFKQKVRLLVSSHLLACVLCFKTRPTELEIYCTCILA